MENSCFENASAITEEIITTVRGFMRQLAAELPKA
jgi:hypothetical protein